MSAARGRPARCDKASAWLFLWRGIQRSVTSRSWTISRSAAVRHSCSEAAASANGAVQVIDHHLAVAVDGEAVRAAIDGRFEQRDQRAVFGFAAVAVAGGARNLDALAARSQQQRRRCRNRPGSDGRSHRTSARQGVGLPSLRTGRLAAARPASAASAARARGQQAGQRTGAGARLQRIAQRLLLRAAGAAGQAAAGAQFCLEGG